MGHPENRRLDVAGLGAAGLANLLALGDAGLLLAPGFPQTGGDLAARSTWLITHAGQWQIGWAFWFVVTLTFAWSYYALARHLDSKARQWCNLAIGAALLAAAVDLVGIVINIAVLPQLATLYQNIDASGKPAAAMTYTALETLATGLTNVTAFGLYTLGGLLLLPALFATSAYPRRLAWLGAATWTISAVTTILLALVPPIATGPFLLTVVLYVAWVWAGAGWLWQSTAQAPPVSS